MRSLFLSLVLGLATLGMMATPSASRADDPNRSGYYASDQTMLVDWRGGRWRGGTRYWRGGTRWSYPRYGYGYYGVPNYGYYYTAPSYYYDYSNYPYPTYRYYYTAPRYRYWY
jgi:hypothetical protein